jgi:hypothetical protein
MALHLDERLHAKAGIGEPPMRRRGIGHREGGEMHAGMARHGGLELAAERRIGGLEQRLDIAASQHRRDVAGAGGTLAAVGAGVDLNGNRCRSKAHARERAARRLGIPHEMSDVVEEDLPAHGKLAVGLGLPC